jgi:hypothetical protein
MLVYTTMKVVLLIILLLVVVAFYTVQPPPFVQREPRAPVYIDQPAMYFDRAIPYSEWP